MNRSRRLARPLLAILLMTALLVGVSACASDAGPDVDLPAEDSGDGEPAGGDETTAEDEAAAPALGPAEYELTFTADWSAATHPTDFPDNPHFSGLIGAVHSSAGSFWAPMTMASPGMQNMAETGGKSPLDSEIEALIEDGIARELISGSGVNPSPGESAVTFTVTDEYPLVSVVTMIAPSPDWFVGVASVSMRDTDAWLDEIEFEMYPWDAGTDDGVTYDSANEPTPEHMTMMEMEAVPPVAVNGGIPSFGTMHFTRVK